MKNKYLISLTLASVLGYILSSCSFDPMQITNSNEEAYTKNFIKTFGLIDPDQDFNEALDASVTINVGDYAKEVKVYTKVNDSYYLVARLKKQQGTIEVPIDVPEKSRELMVVVDGKKYFTQVGGHVAASSGVASRSFDYTGYDENETTPVLSGITVVDKYNEVILPTPVASSFLDKIPEIDEPNAYPGNTKVEGLITNFTLTGSGDPFIIYPLYWNTSQADQLGIYYFTSDVENKTDIVRVPIYTIKGSHVYTMKPKTEAEYVYLNIYGGENHGDWGAFEALWTWFTNEYGTYPTYADFQTPTNATKAKIDEIIKTVYGNEAYYDEENSSADNQIVIAVGGTVYTRQQAGQKPSYSVDPEAADYTPYVVSEGIQVTVPRGLRFGFYIKHPSNYYLYTEREGNVERAIDTYGASAGNVVRPEYNAYAAVFEQKVTIGDNSYELSYLTFEDWYGGSGDYDLNDVAFYVYGLDFSTQIENYDKQETGGGGEGTNPGEGEQQEGQPLAWIIAAEDLGSLDDFDFNDVVFKVNSITTGEGDEMKKEFTIKALAAGGTLPVYLHYRDTEGGSSVEYLLGPGGAKEIGSIGASEAETYEWHNWFGTPGRYSYRQMINTQGLIETTTASCTFEVSKDATIQDFGFVDKNGSSAKVNTVEGFYITVDTYNTASEMVTNDKGEQNASGTNERCLTFMGAGKAPQMFLIQDLGNSANGRWQWPSERTHITSAYPLFYNWVGDKTTEWQNTVVDASYVLRPVDDYKVSTGGSSTGGSSSGGGTTPSTPSTPSQGTEMTVTSIGTLFGNDVLYRITPPEGVTISTGDVIAIVPSAADHNMQYGYSAADPYLAYLNGSAVETVTVTDDYVDGIYVVVWTEGCTIQAYKR